MLPNDTRMSESEKRKARVGKKPGASEEGIDYVTGHLNLLVEVIKVVVMSHDEKDGSLTPVK